MPDALKRGLITEAELDVSLRRLLTLRFRLGQFDPPERVPYRAIPPSANDAPAHDQLALAAARQSLVLLKNDGTLPFDSAKLKTVAVLGPTGGEVSALLGNYNDTPTRKITLVEAIRAKLETRGVEIDVPLERLRRWDEAADRYVVDPGAWRFAAGPASDRATLTAALQVRP